MRRGDTVITSGGLVGKVTKVVDDDQIEVEIADGVRVRQVRSMVSGVRAKGEPVKDDAARADRSSSSIDARTGTVRINALHFQVEANGDPAHGVHRLPVRGPEFLPREDGPALAEMGAAPHRARPRPAGRLAHPARGRCRRRAQGEGRAAARRGPPGPARRPRRLAGRPGRFAATASRCGFAKAISSRALTKLRELSQPLGGLLGATGQRSVDVVNVGGGLVRLTLTEPAIIERIRQAVEQSIQIVDRRVNELGTVEPLIQRQGVDRILVQVPGLQDPTRLKELLGKTAKLDFRMVDQSMTAEQALQTRPPPESEILYGTAKEGKQPYLIEKRVIVSGGDLTDAQPGFDSAHQRADRHLPLQFLGRAQIRARRPRRTSGRPFAIVLDNEVISAPVIREPIIGGSGQISGNFTVESANDLAILLRAGALPAPLTIIEERVVGAGLGQDSIEKGRRASYYGAALVVVFMIVTYGLFGVFASIAVGVNVGMIFGVLSLLNATLTLPGHHRHRADHRHRGRQQRADLRAHPRGGAHRPLDRSPPSTPASRARSRPSSIPTSPRSSPPRCCSSSAPVRCAASR